MTSLFKKSMGILLLSALSVPALAMRTESIQFELLSLNGDTTITIDKDTLLETYVIRDDVFDKIIHNHHLGLYERDLRNDSHWTETSINKDLLAQKDFQVGVGKQIVLGNVNYAYNSSGKVFTTFVNFKFKQNGSNLPEKECKMQFSTQAYRLFLGKNHGMPENSHLGFFYGMNLINKSGDVQLDQLRTNDQNNSGICSVTKTSVDHDGVSLIRKFTITIYSDHTQNK